MLSYSLDRPSEYMFYGWVCSSIKIQMSFHLAVNDKAKHLVLPSSCRLVSWSAFPILIIPLSRIMISYWCGCCRWCLIASKAMVIITIQFRLTAIPPLYDHWMTLRYGRRSSACGMLHWCRCKRAGGRHNMPRPLQVDLWHLTLKVMSESRVTWATSVPNLVFI